MPAITVRHKPKPFTWSYSRLKNYRTCPKRYFHCDVNKDVPFEETDEIKWGHDVHAALANRISKGIQLPEGMRQWDKWAQQILTGAGKIEVEQKMAFSETFEAKGYFEDGVWFRGVGDVIKISPDKMVAAAYDWKTGKIVEDSEQLQLMAQCVFSKHPEVQAVLTKFVWLKEDAETTQVFKRSDMPMFWVNLRPEIEALKQAEAELNFPATPNRLCGKYCPVMQCPHNGFHESNR